ncbi:uncharacterized protein [Macrobrachium rosenbergii]
MAKIPLLLLVAGVGCLMHDVGATSNEKVFYRTRVTSENLTSSSVSEVVSVNSLIGCAHEANKRSWCHLICYDGQECSLYDVMIPKIHNITNATTNNCWTDTEVLPSCPADFVEVEGAGCLYVNTQQGPMVTADTFCKSIKSRLVIPPDVAALTAFAKKLRPLEKYYWVGIKDAQWMDGTTVLASQMGRTDYGPIPCAYLHEAVDYGIIGYGCDFSMPSICQYVS